MNDEKPNDLASARQHLEDGDPTRAFAELRRWLTWPQTFDSSADWSDSWVLFADIADAVVGPDLGDLAREVSENPIDVEKLYDLGYELVEVGLPGLAASVFARANELQPGHEQIVCELVHALETAGYNSAAAETLKAEEGLLERSFMCRYLLAFNAVMSADIETAREILPSLETSDEDERYMTQRILQFIERYYEINRVSPLDENDLRGWHFVSNGAMLLHLSPYGFEDAMRGRYAFVQDSMSLCHDAIQRVHEVLSAWSIEPECVWLLPDRDSRILGMATAEMLGLQTQEWPDDGTTDPGLVVAYDLANLSGELLEQLYTKSPGQILWQHAASWTEVSPFAADLHSFLYQHNVTPWGQRMSVDSETEDVVQIEPDERDDTDLAREIIEASPDLDGFDDVAELRALAISAARLAPEDGPTALAVNGHRPVFWECSPVKSNRFY